MGFEPTNGGFADQSWISILLARLAFTPSPLADFGPDLGPIVPKLFLISVQVLSNAIERLKGSPASPGPKRVFRTVVSELARGLTCPCKPVGHANEHKRTIKPGILTGLVQQANVRANMSIDELARTYIARIEWQQRAQSTGQFPLIRDTSGCAPHFSAGTRFQSTSGGRIHCEECGLWMNARKCCGARVMSMHWP